MSRRRHLKSRGNGARRASDEKPVFEQGQKPSYSASESSSQRPQSSSQLPVDSAPLLSQLTYSWLSPLMNLGNQRTLEVSDLWEVDPGRSASTISSRFDEALKSQRLRASAIARGAEYPSPFRSLWWSARRLVSSASQAELEKHWRAEAGRETPSLPSALNNVAGPFFWIGGLCKVFADISQMMGPVLIKAIINFAKERSKAQANGIDGPPLPKGLLLALGLLVLTVTTSLIHHQFFWRSIVAGTLSRTALISSMYKRSVRLSNKSKTKLSNATIINFISTDMSRVEACAQWFHPVWAAPIQVSICLMILLYQLGPSALAGFMLFILVIPLQKHILGRQFHIRKRLGKLTELRTKSLLGALGSMHLVKCYTLETPILGRISALRKSELAGVKDIQNIQSANAALAFSLPVLAATLSFITYSRSGDFDLAVMFASLSLFQLLRQPMTFWPRALSLTGDALNSLRRLSAVYSAELRPEPSTSSRCATSITISPHQNLAISVKDATFQWESSVPSSSDGDKGHATEGPTTQTPFSVQATELNIPRGSLVAVAGPVASGKSSLLQALIGEMRRTCGEVSIGGSVAYCPQVPWMQRGSLRDNVVFGKAFNEERYGKALKAACLLEDLEELPNGDLTEIGENGVNVSGGQRQRISLARGLYADADILILDDPLSGVDPRVGNAVFQNAILNTIRYQSKTIILTTYSRELLAQCDWVVYLQDGRISEQGRLDDLRLAKNLVASSPGVEDDDVIRKGAKGAPENKRPKLAPRFTSYPNGKANGSGPATRAVDKPAQKKTPPIEVYRSYLAAARGVLSIPTLIAATIFMQSSQVLSSRSLVWWQSNAFGESLGFYQGMYAGFGMLQAFSTFILGTTVDSISCLVSQNIHDEALRSVLHAPMSFFDSTPRGRILSSFGKDIDSIDNQLPVSIRTLCLTIATVVGSVAVITYIQPYLVVVAFFVMAGYHHFHQVHRTTARQIKRIESTLRSNIYAHITESLNGLQTLRSYDQVDRSINETNQLLDLQNRASFVAATNQRWLSVRIDFCGAALVFAVALCAVLGVGGIGAAQIGLILTYTTTLTQMAGLLTRQIADVEIQMNSFERLTQYTTGKLFTQEDALVSTTEPKSAPANWPSEGSISIRDLSVSYRPGQPSVLHGISLDVRPGEKVGIVGRTGAGKSSFVNCLVRIVEYEGRVEIDGVDISAVNLKTLRSKVSFVPQQPVVFGGTVRSALDPHEQYDDDTLRNALNRGFSQLDCESSTKGSGRISSQRLQHLDTVIEPEGANLSMGEKALLSTTRVLLRNSKVVILDEATASIDLETDEFVQRAIHREFRDRTLLCIAHRITTVLAYDRILVLNAGNAVELDTPLRLFEKGGFFHELCAESRIRKEDILNAKWGARKLEVVGGLL